MRINPVLKYNLYEFKKAVMKFYLIFFLIILVMVPLSIFIKRTQIDLNIVIVRLNGLELASMIFLFVAGLNSFKEDFLFFSANGISRKTQFYGFVASTIPVVLIMSVIDTVYGTILGVLLDYNSVFTMAYSQYDANVVIMKLATVVWLALLYLMVLMIGYFITVLYFRMSKGWKIGVSIAVPMLFLYILPIMDEMLFSSRITNAMTKAFDTFMGNGHNPYIAMLTFLVVTLIFAALSYSLIRKAEVRE